MIMKNQKKRLAYWLLQLTLALYALASPLSWAQTPQTNGQWQLGPNFTFVPVHTHVLPDSTVMIWRSEAPGEDGPWVWEPVSGIVRSVSRAGYDVFCSAHTFLPDGRLFVAGGHISNGDGEPKASIFNPVTNTWARQPQMNLGRWYPTVTALPNGDVLVVSGTVDQLIGNNTLPQVWELATGTWRDLTSAQLGLPDYPNMFLAPNGSVFNAGPGISTRYLNTAGTGAWTEIANRTFNGLRDYGGAVMYEPGKILFAGGGDPPTATAEVIDLNAATPAWRAVNPMSTARRMMNATMLPDGKVFVSGGSRGPGFANGDPGMPVLTAEMWDPATEAWSTMATATLPRLYHSTALLLPDARVIVTGGENVTQTEIFSPPYLFAGPRPSISSAPANVGKGQSFFMGTPDATGITGMSWVAMPSVTHTHNMNQGFFRSTSITPAAGGVNLIAPNDPTITAGFYMVFLLKNGVPSVAKIIQLGAASNSAPSITSMAPASATAGGPAFSLAVTGSNFLASSKVRWNGADRPTTFVSATQLTAAIPASDIAAAGSAQVSVSNPAPGGGTSLSLAFAINAAPAAPPASNNPVPVLSSITPASATAGGAAFTLTATGSNFIASSKVRWNGIDRPTTFVNATQLTAAIPASDIATANTAQVTVLTPAPGGGTSGAQPFTISATPSTPNLASLGTPIAKVTAPQGTGARSLEVIRDGVMPAVGSADSATQYDTWTGAAATDDWVGYEFGAVRSFNRVVFQEGRHFADGGWFTSLTVQVRQAGAWVNVARLASTPAYPGVNNGINFESYSLQFDAISGDAIRIYGAPGGAATFISVAELQVYGDANTPPPPPPPAAAAAQNLASLGTPIAKVTAPQGGGARSLEVIRDGVMPAVGSADSATQYDTWTGAAATDDWVGYEFSAARSFNRVVFQEGRHFADGGWFTSLTVQVRQAGNWVNVARLASTPAYPGTNNGTSYETYSLQFDAISGDAIRIYGAPGGTATFISVAELQVYGDGAATPPPPPPPAAAKNLASLGSPIAKVTAPQGTGARSLEVIRDGVMPAVGSADSAAQYDTWTGAASTDDWVGYQFTSAQSFNRVVFQEGRHFADGGWFASLTVQVRQAGNWVNVARLASTPAYPGTNNGVSFESYSLQFDTIMGDAIRIYGAPGGSATFISVAELQIYGP
jgi:Domain of unknown function (DUF1929)/IPT/TIG domain